jgi:hypothetical protein
MRTCEFGTEAILSFNVRLSFYLILYSGYLYSHKSYKNVTNISKGTFSVKWKPVTWQWREHCCSGNNTASCRLLLTHLAGILLKRSIFRDITPCIPLKICRRFGGTRSLQLRGRRMRALLTACFMLVSCFACSSILKMETTRSSETPIDFQWTIRRYIPENRTLYNHRCENLKSYKAYYCLVLNLKIHYYRIIKWTTPIVEYLLEFRSVRTSLSAPTVKGATKISVQCPKH